MGQSILSEDQLKFIKSEKKVTESQSCELTPFNTVWLLMVPFTAVPKGKITPVLGE
jgi:hypothetical protein